MHSNNNLPPSPCNQVKKMNLESMTCDLDEIIHEAQLMKNYNHPNVLPLHTSFVTGQELWMVMPFISGGSVLHIIKYSHPEVRGGGGRRGGMEDCFCLEDSHVSRKLLKSPSQHEA